MKEHLQSCALLFRREFATLNLGNDAVYGGYDIALFVLGHGVVGVALIDIGVVPGLRESELLGMTCVIQPVGIIYQRVAVQYLCNLLSRCRCEMTLGDVGYNIVALLTPRKGVGGTYHGDKKA